jgi:rhamnose transport system substrate-binding protein
MGIGGERMNHQKAFTVGVSAALLVGMLGGAVSAQSPSAAPATSASAPVSATPGQDVKMLLLPKFLGILPFDQANQGAQEAAAELQNPTAFDYDGPDQANSVAGQIDLVTNAPTKGYKVVMMSNNAGDQIVPAAQAAQAAGTKVVTWDSPIPSGTGESLFVAQVDFTSIGQVMADMTLDIVGPDGGQVAILSASPDAANQNAWIKAYNDALAADAKYSKIQIVDTVYGNDQSEESYNQALALIDKYPDLKLIMSPTSVGIVAAAKALTDENLWDKV